MNEEIKRSQKSQSCGICSRALAESGRYKEVIRCCVGIIGGTVAAKESSYGEEHCRTQD